ncbi:MAG: hypothetical protein R3F43_04350, partial [bacterium]
MTATDRDGVTTGKILRWTAGFPVAGRVMPGPARHMEIIAELPDDRGRWWTVATGSTTADGHFHLALPTCPDGPIGLVAKATEGTTIIDPEGHALAWPDQVLRSYVLPAHFNRPALVTPWTTLAWWLAQPVDPDLAERFAAYAEALAAHLQLRPERDLLVGEGERDHHLLSLACFVGATAAQESPLTYLRDLRMDALDHRLTGTFPDAGEGRDPLRRELAEGCPDDASFSWMARVIANNDARLFGPYGGRKVDVVAPEVTVELIEAGGLIRTLPGGEHALSGPVTLVITAQDDVSSPQAPQIRLDGRLGPAALTDVERHTPRPHQLVVRGTLDPAALPPGVPVVLDVTVADEAGNQTRNTLNIIGFSDAVEPTVDIRGATEAMPGVWVLRRGEPTTARLEFRTGSLRTALVTLDGGALQASAVEAASQLTTPLALEAAPDGRYALRWDAVDVFDRPVVATAELIVDHTPPRITWLPTTYRDERDARVVLGPDGPEIVIGDAQVELGPDQPQPLPLYKLTSRLDDADDPNPAALRWQVDGEEFSDRVRFGAIGGPVARRVDAITWQIGLTTATTGFGPRTAPGDTWPRQARELVAVDLAGNEARVSLPTVVAALVAPPLHIEALELAAQGDALAPADVASLDRVDGRHLVGRWRLRNPWPEARIVQPAHLALDVDVATRLRPAGGPAEILGVGRAEGDELIFERPGQLDRRVVLGCLAGAGRGQMAEAVELPAGGLLEAYLRIRLYRCLARQGEGPPGPGAGRAALARGRRPPRGGRRRDPGRRQRGARGQRRRAGRPPQPPRAGRPAPRPGRRHRPWRLPRPRRPRPLPAVERRDLRALSALRAGLVADAAGADHRRRRPQPARGQPGDAGRGRRLGPAPRREHRGAPLDAAALRPRAVARRARLSRPGRHDTVGCHRREHRMLHRLIPLALLATPALARDARPSWAEQIAARGGEAAILCGSTGVLARTPAAEIWLTRQRADWCYVDAHGDVVWLGDTRTRQVHALDLLTD